MKLCTITIGANDDGELYDILKHIVRKIDNNATVGEHKDETTNYSFKIEEV